MTESWADFYQSDLQSVYLLQVVPLGFLAFRALPRTGLARRAAARGRGVSTAEPAAAAFVSVWAWIFAVETCLDPLATGPLARVLGDTAGTVLSFAFVWLGDFRVFALVFAVAAAGAEPRRFLRNAALASFAVPVFAGLADAALRARLEFLPGQTLWVLYELSFLGVALWLRARFVPARVGAERPTARAFLREVCGYVALYYALWATSDGIILLAGWDGGWALRVLPNQMYYALFVPFVWWRLHAVRRASAG
ncbi:MAG: hypothetical protein O7G30_02055 [Proteobacteria bacterium]|nr:hypothetical protein [Pseudomonadota bacterium]